MKRPAFLFGMRDKDKTRRLAVVVALAVIVGTSAPEMIGAALF